MSSSSSSRRRNNGATHHRNRHGHHSNKNKTPEDALDLINFRFESSSHITPPTSHSKKRNANIYRYTPPPCFPLFCSSLHAFGVSPDFILQENQKIPSWQADIVLVKCLVLPQEETCCICLDSFVVPRILKCGHVYCIKCLLRIQNQKCPCCNKYFQKEEWKPVVFQTIQYPCKGNLMSFQLLKRTKTGMVPFTCNNNGGGIPKLGDVNAPYCRYNIVDPQFLQELYRQELMQLQRLEEEEEEEASMVDMAVQYIYAELTEIELLERKQQQVKPNNKEHDSATLQQEEQVQFYQSTDGQACFLSAFNVKCLMAEHSTDSLPETIQAQVLNLQHMQLTPKTNRGFLKHLPAYMDVVFVEVNLYNNNKYLSKETQKQFQHEFMQRKQQRQRANKRQEQKQKQQYKSQPTRIMSTTTSHEMNLAPPPLGIEFGPALSSSSSSSSRPTTTTTTRQAPAFQFSQVCATNGVWPELNNTPTMTTTTTAVSTAWGGRSNNSNKSTPSTTSTLTQSNNKSKKKKREKIVLFSTGGGHVGSAY